jgi:PAS domain S-box-containing protein
LKSLTRYQSVFETTIDGIIVINSSGIIDAINPSGLLLFGYEKEELIGKNVSVLMKEPDRSNHDGYIKKYEKTQKPKIIGIGREVEGMKKDGSMFPFRLAVNKYSVDGDDFYTGIVHDLTNQKEHEKYIKEYSEKLELMVADRTQLLEKEIELKEAAQAALIESQKLYEAIAVNFPNGTITVLDREMNIVFMEGSELNELGFGTARLLGEDYISMLPKDVRALVKEKVLEVFEDKAQSFNFNLQAKRYGARCVPLHNNQGDIDQVLLVVTNITKEKQAEDEIYNALQKEKHLNELKTKFVSMASHEFRTPLSGILSSAGLIEKYTKEEHQENRLKHVQKVKKNVRNLNMILNDFLSLEKMEVGLIKNNPEPIILTEFLDELIEESAAVTKDNQGIICDYYHKQEKYMLDPFLLRNMLNNLLSNAAKYSEKDIKVLTNEKNNKLHITVKDNGIGISKEDQANLFNRFFRASNAGNIPGTGLGLNIVRRYANIMNAEVIFESTLNKGSSFSILFTLEP